LVLIEAKYDFLKGKLMTSVPEESLRARLRIG